MPNQTHTGVWGRFGDFELHSERGLLSVKGFPVRLQLQPLRLLEILVRRAPSVVTREELGDHVWGKGVHVELDTNLNYCIRQIRLALRDNAASPKYIETLPKQGYRLLTPVEILPSITPPEAPVPNPQPISVPPPSSPPAWRSAHWLIPSAVIVVLAAAIPVRHYLSARSTPRAEQPSPSLAILPMVNATSDPANDALADGFTEDLIRQTVQLKPLRVTSRTSSFHYKGTNPDVRAVGHDLKVAMVLTERLESRNDQPLVDIELSRVDDGAILLTQQYRAEGSGQRADLQPVKAQVLRDVARSLGMSNLVEGDGAVTTNPDAYRAYLQGLGAVRSGEPADLHRGIASFEQAIQLDPHFAQAWGYLAEAHTYLGLYYAPATQEMPQAQQALAEALRLDPKNEEFHGTLGLIDLVYAWDLPAARRELAAAGPQTAAFHVLSCSAHLLHETGESRAAEDLVLRLAADEPDAEAVVAELGCVNYYRRDFETAVARYREAMKVDPHSPIPYWGLGKSLTQQGKYKEAIATLQSFPAGNGMMPPILSGELGYTYARAKRTAEAQHIIDTMAAQRHQIFVDPYLTAVVYLGLGDRDNCFRWLNDAEAQRSPFLISILTDPKWSDLITDPRFIALSNRLHPTLVAN